MNKKVFFLVPIFLSLFFIGSSSAISDTYYVSIGADDWYDTSSTSTIMFTQDVRVAWPHFQTNAWAEIDTSDIPDNAVITSGTLSWYVDSYMTSKGISKVYSVQIFEGDYPIVYSGTYVSAGWVNHALISGEFDDIDVDGVTKIKFIVPAVGDFQSRSMGIRTYEYSGEYRVHLDVTYTIPVEGYCDTDYDGDGDWIINETIVCNEDVNMTGSLVLVEGGFLTFHKDYTLKGGV
jgi:hypothetical protein